MDAGEAGAGTAAAVTSPTRSAQEVLRRMSLNSPPSRTDNPRHIKRAKLLGGERGAPAYGKDSLAAPRNTSGYFEAPAPLHGAAETPMKQREHRMSYSPRASLALEAPSPMPTWGGGNNKGGAMSLRDASYGEALEASDPSSFYPSFQLECLRQPYDSQQQSEESRDGKDDSGDHDISASTPLATHRLSSIGGVTTTSTPSTTVDDNASVAMDGEDDGGTPPPSPPRDETGARRAGNHGTPTRQGALVGSPSKAFGSGAIVPDTPQTRPGSAMSRDAATGVRGHRSCSPVGADGSGVGSPVKKRGVGRWRLSGGGGGVRGDGFGPSPPRSNRNPFSPEEDSMSMPAPPPRSSRLSSGAGSGSDAGDGSPMDTTDMIDAVDFGAISAGHSGGKAEENSFLRRISTGSCASSCSSVGKGAAYDGKDLSKPSPCDVTAFVPITPYRAGLPGLGTPKSAVGVDHGPPPMSLAPDAGGGLFVRAGAERGRGGGERGRLGKGEARGRFVSDFEELKVIGSGCFGTVYEVQSRLDGCKYAVKCTRRKFKGEADRQNMLREVYALAAVCAAHDTINIVRYHQAWIEDERLYIQTELCETSLEKQLESGQLLDIPGVYAFLRQTLLGLEILHQHSLVHLDIKPGNIFVKNGQYKLGDFGLVAPAHATSGTDVMEGDSRYMSKELLNDDHSNLTKCDVFSLGITLYEIVTSRPLPPNGEEWHRLRSGKFTMPMGLPAELCRTLTEMMHSEASCRPSAAELLRYPCLQSEMERQLNDQRSKLNKERNHNQALKQEVSALIQKQSQRSGRLSRTITWDNSFFSKSDSSLMVRKYDSNENSKPTGAPISRTRTDIFSTMDRLADSNSNNSVGENTSTSAQPTAHSGRSLNPSSLFGSGSTAPLLGASLSSQPRGNAATAVAPQLPSRAGWAPFSRGVGSSSALGAVAEGTEEGVGDDGNGCDMAVSSEAGEPRAT